MRREENEVLRLTERSSKGPERFFDLEQEKKPDGNYQRMSLYAHLSHFGICLRSSVKQITAINTSILLVGLLHNVSWYRENYPGLVLVLSAMTRLWRRRSRKKEPILIARSKASQRERKDLPSDQNDLKSWTAEKIADESLRISSIRSARLGKGREFESRILIRA